jgi:hypothetical protein
MSDFFKQHFDKLLLSSLFLIALGTFMHFARSLEFYATEANAAHLAGIVSWLENTVGQVLAALLTLMVGRGLSASATATPGGGSSASSGDDGAGPAAVAASPTSAIPPLAAPPPPLGPPPAGWGP